MKILVIGNGFDIAHGLKTQYSQFLDFVNHCLQENCDDEYLADHFSASNTDWKHIAEQVKRILSRDNMLLQYFLKIYETRCNEGKKGWIDFESEIFLIILELEKARDEQKEGKKLLSMEVSNKLLSIIGNTKERNEFLSTYRFRLTNEFIEKKAEILLNDLNDITKLLEIYLFGFVESVEVEKLIPEIQNLHEVTHVLSFNYTDTYARLYGDDNTEYCFIHGKIECNRSNEDCNLVLGIDEYLNDEKKNTDNAFIWFKKFYQRIYKETSSSYVDWLDLHLNNNTSLNQASILDVYFYGHSLDETDKDVLQKLILHKNTNSHIFYMNKTDLAKKISNLVKIIGEDNLIHMTRGSGRTIKFIKIKT